MKIESVEIFLVFAIIAIQIIVFTRTLLKILLFKKVIPDVSKFYISVLNIPKRALETLSPDEILSNADYYEKNNEPSIHAESRIELTDGSFVTPNSTSYSDLQATTNSQYVEISIIKSGEYSNPVLRKILNSINNYLLRNRGAASDFNLIKDIAERNTNAIEEDINLTISVPLYLGLMGTMLGIVVGLFSMSDLSLSFSESNSTNQLGEGISVLLGGVKIAMLASLSGLLLTIINSGWFFKEAKSKIESNKNDFYTFIQTELLPIINQSIGSTFESLQRNLLKFNGEFSDNLSKLSGIFSTNYETLLLQDRVLSNLEKIDIATVAKYNIKVLKELQVSTNEFEKFNIHVSQINSFVNNSSMLTERINEVLSRTGNFQKIAENLDGRLSESQQLIEFVSKHFQDLEGHRQYVNNSVAEVGHSISDTFKELKEHIQNSSKSVKDFTVEEIELLKKALGENKTNLNNLQFLESLNKELSQLKTNSNIQGQRMQELVDELNHNISKSTSLLEDISHSSLAYKVGGMKKSFLGLFSSKKE